MRASDISVTNIEQVFVIYRELLDPDGTNLKYSFVTPSQVVEGLQEVLDGDDNARHQLTEGYRIGTKWGDDEKLALEIERNRLRIFIRTNLPPGHPDEKASENDYDEFERRVRAYFKGDILV